MSTLDTMKKLMALKLPAKFLLPIMEIFEGGVTTKVASGPVRQRRKRRTKEQMMADAGGTRKKRKKKTKAAPSA